MLELEQSPALYLGTLSRGLAVQNYEMASISAARMLTRTFITIGSLVSEETFTTMQPVLGVYLRLPYLWAVIPSRNGVGMAINLRDGQYFSCPDANSDFIGSLGI